MSEDFCVSENFCIFFNFLCVLHYFVGFQFLNWNACELYIIVNQLPFCSPVVFLKWTLRGDKFKLFCLRSSSIFSGTFFNYFFLPQLPVPATPARLTKLKKTSKVLLQQGKRPIIVAFLKGTSFFSLTVQLEVLVLMILAK